MFSAASGREPDVNDGRAANDDRDTRGSRAAMISRTDIEFAYRFLLGREPESDEVILDKLRRCSSWVDLRTHFMASEEFRQQLPHLGRPEHGPIEVACDSPVEAKLFDRTMEQWEVLGRERPFWGVLTEDDYLPHRISSTRERFFETGKKDIQEIVGALPDDFVLEQACVLELGCGVGRLTLPLAEKARTVIGVDVSLGNLSVAKELAAQAKAQNCTFLHVGDLKVWNQITSDVTYDFFISLITLQHNVPPVQMRLLDSALQGLKSGGVAAFQVTTGHSAYSFVAEEFLEANLERVMDMHSVPMRDVFELMRCHSCWPIEVYRDLRADPATHSYTVVCRKADG